MRLATCDIGTNSVNLLIAEVDGQSVSPLVSLSRVARLGEGLDSSRSLRMEAVQRVAQVVADYSLIAREYGVPRLFCTATSAARDASNPEVLRASLEAIDGVQLEILSGEDEAHWSFVGARSGLTGVSHATIIDIGGGSTELIAGGEDGVVWSVSMDIGSVRFTERFGLGTDRGEANVRALEQAVDSALDVLGPDRVPAPPFVGIAGTVTSLAAVEIGMNRYDGSLVDGLPLSLERVQVWRDRLRRLSGEDTLALAPGILEGRADVFYAGVSILERVMTRFELDGVLVTDRGLRHGWALRQATH